MIEKEVVEEVVEVMVMKKESQSRASCFLRSRHEGADKLAWRHVRFLSFPYSFPIEMAAFTSYPAALITHSLPYASRHLSHSMIR